MKQDDVDDFLIRTVTVVLVAVFVGLGLCIWAWGYAIAQHKALVCVQVEQGKLAPPDYKCTTSEELF